MTVGGWTTTMRSKHRAGMLAVAWIGMLCSVVPSAQSGRTLTRPANEAAGQRRALVVGNDAYTAAGLTRLRNGVSDANALGTLLRDELGFEVTVLRNAGARELDAAVTAFVQQVDAADLALFYFSGHGVGADDGFNYLLPIDYPNVEPADLKYNAMPANRVLDRLGAKTSRVVLILDACRNNPFRGTRDASQGGLVDMRGVAGSLVAFATAPGGVADDNPTGANGLYTSHLLRALRQEGLTLDQVFNAVSASVADVTKAFARPQVPWKNASGLIGVYVLRNAKYGGAPVESMTEHAVSETPGRSPGIAKEPSPPPGPAISEESERIIRSVWTVFCDSWSNNSCNYPGLLEVRNQGIRFSQHRLFALRPDPKAIVPGGEFLIPWEDVTQIEVNRFGGIGRSVLDIQTKSGRRRFRSDLVEGDILREGAALKQVDVRPFAEELKTLWAARRRQ